MRIIVKDGENTRIRLRLPTFLAMKIMSKVLSGEGGKSKSEGVSKAVREARKQWGHLKLIEVTSADGSYVLITL